MKRLVGIATALGIASVASATYRAGIDAAPTSKSAVQAVDSLESPAAPGSAQPSLAVGPNGKVHMSWLESADSGFALRFAVFDGTRWSAPRTVRSGRDFFVNWADFPSMEVFPDGRIAAHWLQRTAGSSYAYGVRISQSRDGGASWSAPMTPHRDSSDNEHGFVTLWHEGSSLGAVWLDGRKFVKQAKSPQGHASSEHSPTNEMMLIATMLGPKGERGVEVPLDDRTCDCCQTTATMTANGPIVAYRNRSAEEIRDIYVVRRVSGKWTTPAVVNDDKWHIAACPVNGPAITAAGNRIALAWFTAANDSPRVKLAISTDGGAKFGPPIRIDEGNPAGRVDVEMLSDGSALVSWIERTGGEIAVVRARRVARDGTVGTPITIATSSAARASGFPRMTIVGDKAMFAWTAPGRPSTVRVARISLAGLK